MYSHIQFKFGEVEGSIETFMCVCVCVYAYIDACERKRERKRGESNLDMQLVGEFGFQ